MKGLVLYKGENYFTHLKKIFVSIDNMQKEYNWLITDYECHPLDKKIKNILSNDWCWITGEEFSNIIDKEDVQWIWGVFSAFPKYVNLEDVLKSKLPIVENNKNIWKNPVNTQHPLAEIEIIAFDSSMTIFISKDERIANMFAEKFSLSEDLEKYNSI